jgi:hypothetical protein
LAKTSDSNVDAEGGAAAASNDKQALVSSSPTSNTSISLVVGLVLSAVMIFISVILSGSAYTQVNSNSLCSSDVSYTECYFQAATSVAAAAPSFYWRLC